MDVSCSAEPCPVILNATCVFYEGDNLIYTGINTNDSLQTAIQKIDAKFEDAGLGYIFQNGIIQSAPGQPVKLGGSLTQNTVILSNGYTFKISDSIESAALITTGGTSFEFVKGDGSLDSTSYQPSGAYITALTGDVIANGPGSVNATLATVFGAPGTYGNSGSVPSITVDAKGRVTNVTPIPINYPAQSLSFVGDVDGFGFTGSPVTLTLDTVNTDVYGSNNFLKFAVNGKGLITSATPVSGGDITTALGYVPVDDAIELTINGVAHDLTANRIWDVGTVTTVGVSAGLGISASVSNPNTIPVINIVNTAPDQTVRLNAGFGISVTGSYPNFTITNDYPDLPNEGVTSFSAGNLSPLFTTSVINPTTTPALNFALSSAAANTVFAGPDGGAGAPTFRSLLAADIPSLSYISCISTTAPLATTGGLTPTLSISQAGASTDGYLSSTDWNTFNNKQNALGYTPVPDSRQLTINGTIYDLTADRCWSVGTVTSVETSGPLTGGTITNSGTIGITQAGAGSDGYLSSADWNTFNDKQASGNYITDLTGDATASGPGSVALTLATVNATTGTFGSSTQVPVITVNNKGLVTCVTTDTISGSLEFVGDVTGVGSTGTCTSLTLATVNNDVYTSETLLNVAVNGKGLITSANPTTAGDICSTLGYTPENVANKSTSTSLGTSNTLYPTQLAVKTYVDSATAGGIILQGNWNAATNTPNISGTTTTGWAWRVDVPGTTNLGGITDWQVGDLAVKSATGWVKIDNTENVTSVFGRFGAIVATTGDYLTCQVTECGNLYYTDARVRAAVGHTAPLTYNSTTGVFGISQSNATTDGYLSATDWNTFNDKQPLIAAGTTSQYYRGDKTFQTLDTSVVTEGSNLYFTDARARGAVCAASGVAYNSTTGQFTNSCPDQIVSLTGGGTTSITGTYPNFCITSNDCFTGTVTSVSVTGTNIGVTGSPITSAGTIGLSLSAANVCSALGFSPYNSTNPAGYTTCTGTVTSVAASTSTTGVSITGSPITSSGTLGINVSTASSVCTGLLTAADWNTFNSKSSCLGTVTSVGLTSSTAGVSIACSPVTTSGTISLNIATASSLCTGLLTASDWNSFNSRTSCTGTVTSVNATGTNISVTGGPITTSGTLAISLSGANVCSALGYTPYNASNPNGYTTCVGTVTSAGIVATNINVCNSPVTTSGNICLNLTGANVCSALGFSPAPSSALSAYLPLAGGTMTGTITITSTDIRSNASSSWTGDPGAQGKIQYHANRWYIVSDQSSDRIVQFRRNGTDTSYIDNNGLFVGNISGNSATTGGFTPSQSTIANGIVVRDPSGYIFGNYINMSDDGNPGGGTAITSFITKQGDNYYRSVSVVNAANSIRAGATGTWSINITGSAGSAGSVDFNNITNKTGGTGTYQTSGDFRAPIFYDSDDTGYYADFNSTSNSAMRVRGGTLYGPNPTWGAYLQVGGNGWGGSYASVVATNGNLHLDSAPGYAMYLNNYANGVIYFNGGSYYISSNGSYYNGRSEQVTINYNNDSNASYQLLWGSGNNVYGTGDVWVNPSSDVINARGGFISNGNPWGTSNSAFFPNGITTAGGTNWIYGFTYIGNAPGNGAGHEFYTSGSSYSTGNIEAGGSMRAPIFYDRADTSYYLDLNSESNLYRFTAATMTRNAINYLSINSPFNTRAAQSRPYQNGTMGWGTVDFNTIFSNWGSGFIDTWSNPGNAPGGSSHYVGIQSMHYNFENNSQGYGFQMACAGEASNRYFWRNGWPNLQGWVEMIHSGNIGSQSVSNANTVGGYSVSVAGNANTIPTRNGSGYLIPENWIQLNGIYGLYSPTNNAHLRPNNGSYGSWLMTGSRNGWQGIEFDSGGAGNITMMIATDSNTVGFHNNSYGWQIRWANGTLFCGKNSYGGNDATVWDSSNAPRAASSNLMYYQSFTLNADTMDSNSTGFTYSVNAPFTGPIARFSTGGSYDMWLGGNYGGSGNVFYIRTRNGDNGSMNPWREIITSGNIGNQSVSYANNAGNVSSISGAVNGVYTWTNINYFRSNRNTSSDSPPLQAFSDNGSGAIMSFHRGGYYAVNFGLDSDNVMRIGGWSAAGNRWQLDMSGNMTVAGDVTAYSDARVKENVHTVENALDKTLRMRGVTYNRIDSDDKKTKVGVIAQEILEVLPEVVNQDNAGMYNVSYGNIVGVLIEAIKEQQTQIEELKSQLDGITK